MYWNLGTDPYPMLPSELNSNIRCIEILWYTQHRKLWNSWIVTLDVLKFVLVVLILMIFLCWIVTLDVLKSLSDLYQQTNDNCWIVTLDVLKYLDEDVLIPYENVE